MYGRIVDGNFKAAPVNFIDRNGKTICNFNRNTELMSDNGFKEVVGEMPEVPEGKIAVPEYKDNGDTISVRYELKDAVYTDQ